MTYLSWEVEEQHAQVADIRLDAGYIFTCDIIFVLDKNCFHQMLTFLAHLRPKLNVSYCDLSREMNFQQCGIRTSKTSDKPAHICAV